LACAEIIRRSDSGENPINDAYFCAFGREETADLGHQYNKGDLTEIGTFTGHIRSGDEDKPMSVQIQIRIVGDKPSA
jgi:hypothetical protein